MAACAASFPQSKLPAAADRTHARSRRDSKTLLHAESFSPLLAAPIGIPEPFLRVPARAVAPILMLRRFHTSLPTGRLKRHTLVSRTKASSVVTACVIPLCLCTDALLVAR
jgi:hypothetical protein